ncbi:hypothetical protein ACWGJB_44840 [Streptomyces sp. NPDC054813]
MSDPVRRIDPTTDAGTAAILPGCTQAQIGPCPRCQGLTIRYGTSAQVISPACQESPTTS